MSKRSQTDWDSLGQVGRGAIAIVSMVPVTIPAFWYVSTHSTATWWQATLAIIGGIALPMALVGWLMYGAMMGYTPAGSEATSGMLWHCTSAEVTTGDVLDPARCRRWARMRFAKQPWRRAVPAVYFFPAKPTPAQLRVNVSDNRRGRYVCVDAAAIAGPIYVRGDGAIAVLQPVVVAAEGDPDDA